MIRTWIDAVYDRNYGDVQDVQYNPDQENPIGCWNASDLNRIEKNTAYCAEYMLEKKIVRTPPEITVRENDYWLNTMIPTKDEIYRIINNVRLLVELSSNNPAIADDLPTIYAATQINYVLANQIEFALELMHNQPKLPLVYWHVTIQNGVVASVVRDNGETEIVNSNDVLVAEDEIVTILGVEYGEYAQYQTFTHWSGDPEDIALLDNHEAQQTVFVMPYKNISFTANFETHIPRTLSITNGYISINKDPTATSGPNTGTYFAGDEIMIIANIASVGKAFYEWTGTEEALNQLVGITDAEDPSTCILTMPDCDVSLSSNYINAGKHSVTVNGGSGSGWYDYKDYVAISANPPEHYSFSHWSGNTSYLTDIYSSTQSFYMGDVNISFTANFVYDYNDLKTLTAENIDNTGVVTSSKVIPGTVASVNTVDSTNTSIFVKWTENDTSVSTSNYYSFTMPSYDKTLLANYRNKNEVQVTINYGSHSETVTMTERDSMNITADPPTIEGNRFAKWIHSGLYTMTDSYSSNTSFRAGSSNGTITATYGDYHMLTVNYGSGSGYITEGLSTTINANQAPTSQEFDYWEIVSGDGSIANIYSKITSFYIGTTDAEITAHYKQIPDFTVTVENGKIWNGSAWVTSATLLRDSTNEIKMNPAPTGKQFLQWEVYVNGVLQTDANDVYQPLAEHTTLRSLSRSITLKATYYIPDPEVTYTLTVTRKDGSTEQYNYAAGTDIEIIASQPDEGYVFFRWTGDTSYVAGGIYNESTYVHMPAQNIGIEETYILEGSVPKYHVSMKTVYAECRNEATQENWTTEGLYPAGTIVNIRATGIDNEHYFNTWEAKNHDTNADAKYIIRRPSSAETIITVPDYDVDITPSIPYKNTYVLTVHDGGTSGNYYEGNRADIYFNKEDTNDIHYEFVRWLGIGLPQLELWDGGNFDVTIAGDSLTPQYVKMPPRNVEATASYKTFYRITLVNGTIDEISDNEGYYEAGTTLHITANPAPTGMRFQYWSGDVSGLASKYDPTTTVTTVTGTTDLTAIYSTDTDRNNVGYTALDLKNTNTIDNSDVTIVSGEIEVGFIITDMNGHIYIVTNVDSENDTSTIYRMTKIVEGGNIYE